jgi:hypothetical protein
MTKKPGSEARLNARIDAALGEKLEYLKRRTKMSVTEVVKRSVECYYEEVRRGAGATKAILEESGFVGCAEGDSELSTDYKKSLVASLARKT